MGTALFNVKVLGKEEKSVVLGLRIISAEQPDFYRTKSFALMLLYDPIVREETPDAPLGREFAFEDTLDPGWVNANVDKYIAKARLSEKQNVPVKADLGKMSGKQRRDFWKSDEAPTAKFEIKVTSPEWIEHLKSGMRWDSSAIDVTP